MTTRESKAQSSYKVMFLTFFIRLFAYMFVIITAERVNRQMEERESSVDHQENGKSFKY